MNEGNWFCTRLRLVFAKTNRGRAWKASAKAIGDRADIGEAEPGRASIYRIRVVDARAIRRRACRCDP
jgi:hypothetical protein